MSQLSIQELQELITDKKVDTIVLGFADHYGRLMGKRLEAEYFLENSKDGSHACDYLLTTDMEMNPIPGFAFANWELGYGDFHLVPDLDKIYHATWLRRTAIVLCNLQNTDSHNPIKVSPRAILVEQLKKLGDLGYQGIGASEL